mgnify:CR=1 FL=1
MYRSPNIAYIDNEANNFLPQAVFESGKTTAQQVETEKYALRLVSDCNATLCNLTEAYSAILNVKNKRPWTWNNKLRIGCWPSDALYIPKRMPAITIIAAPAARSSLKGMPPISIVPMRMSAMNMALELLPGITSPHTRSDGR